MPEESIYRQIAISPSEIFDKRGTSALAFALIPLVVRAGGSHWPQSYESSRTLLRDKSLADAAIPCEAAKCIPPVASRGKVSGNGLDKAIVSCLHKMAADVMNDCNRYV
jgi:hypothetical protein